MKTGTKEIVHAKDEVGKLIPVKTNKTVDEIHTEKSHTENQMEQYLKKNPTKVKTKNASKEACKNETATTSKQDVSTSKAIKD